MRIHGIISIMDVNVIACMGRSYVVFSRERETLFEVPGRFCLGEGSSNRCDVGDVMQEARIKETDTNNNVSFLQYIFSSGTRLPPGYKIFLHQTVGTRITNNEMSPISNDEAHRTEVRIMRLLCRLLHI